MDLCDQLDIYPAREIVYSKAQVNIIAQRIREALDQTLPLIDEELAPILSGNIEGYLDKLNDSHYFTGVDKFILIDKKQASLFEYLKESM